MNNIKWISIGVVGSLFAVSHLGMIGYIASKKDEPKLPTLNIPVGPYTSSVSYTHLTLPTNREV